jgi:hypothetical protein
MSEQEKEVTVTRTIPLPIFFPRGDGCPKGCKCEKCEDARAKRRTLVNAIKTYRQTCRKGAAVLFLGEVAGAEIVEKNGDVQVTPKTHPHETLKNKKTGEPMKVPDSKSLLEMAFGKDGAYHAYSMRDYLKQELGNLRSDAADCARDDIVKAWQSGDPEFPKATRGWLCLNFARRVALFNGIGLPVRAKSMKLNDHGLSISLTAGEWMDVKLGKMDGSRYGIWKNIVTGKWKVGDPVRVGIDRDGELIVHMTYRRPPERAADLSPDRVLEVAFTNDREAFIQFKIRTGHETIIDDLRRDWLNALPALDFVDRLSKQTDKMLVMLKGCGSRGERKRGAGNKAAHEAVSRRSENISRTRTNGCRTWNHTWAHRVVAVAARWNCGKIEVYDLPATLFERSWQWYDFEQKLKYKADEKGMTLKVAKSPTSGEVSANLK